MRLSRLFYALFFGLLCISLLCIGGLTPLYAEQNKPQQQESKESSHDHPALQQLESLARCRTTVAALERLSCYDQAWPDHPGPVDVNQPANDKTATGRAWQRAFALEKTRKLPTTDFMLHLGEGVQPTVLLTTPALGKLPPRPILMLSCIDNITRLQVALLQPVHGTLAPLTLTADETRFTVNWFVRENGYLIDGNRGLPGIEDIKRLFNSKQLTISSRHPAVGRLTFNIEHLAEQIKPLRAACHW